MIVVSSVNFIFSKRFESSQKCKYHKIIYRINLSHLKIRFEGMEGKSTYIPGLHDSLAKDDQVQVGYGYLCRHAVNYMPILKLLEREREREKKYESLMLW